MNEIKITNSIWVAVVLLVVVNMVLVFLGGKQTNTFGSAPNGLMASYATSSVLSLPSQSVVTITGTTSCAARVVTTFGVPVTVTLSEQAGQSPSANQGEVVAASSTTVFDSALYGCGKMKVWAFAATSIQFVETR